MRDLAAPGSRSTGANRECEIRCETDADSECEQLQQNLRNCACCLGLYDLNTCQNVAWKDGSPTSKMQFLANKSTSIVATPHISSSNCSHVNKRKISAGTTVLNPLNNKDVAYVDSLILL